MLISFVCLDSISSQIGVVTKETCVAFVRDNKILAAATVFVTDRCSKGSKIRFIAVYLLCCLDIAVSHASDDPVFVLTDSRRHDLKSSFLDWLGDR